VSRNIDKSILSRYFRNRSNGDKIPVPVLPANYRKHLDVMFKNENLVSWSNGSPWICNPDLLTLAYKKSGRGTYNADIKEGDEVVAIGKWSPLE